MTWKDILKAELTRDGFIEFLENYEPYVESSQFRADMGEVMFYHNIANNARQIVEVELPQDKLDKALRESEDYDDVMQEFERELIIVEDEIAGGMSRRFKAPVEPEDYEEPVDDYDEHYQPYYDY